MWGPPNFSIAAMSTLTLVILGTGTDVGKTYFTARLASALAAHPGTEAVTAIKPIESGVPLLDPEIANSALGAPTDQPPARTSDAALLGASSMPIIRPAHAYAFAQPVSPHLAARKSSALIDIGHAADWVKTFRPAADIKQNLSPGITHRTHLRRSWLLVETAGGALSPLNEDATNLRLAELLEPAIWILVAPDRLGVLHDLTTTLYTMKGLSRAPDSVVLTQPPPADESRGTNADELRRLGISFIDSVLEDSQPLTPAYVDRLIQIASALGQ